MNLVAPLLFEALGVSEIVISPAGVGRMPFTETLVISLLETSRVASPLFCPAPDGMSELTR